MARAVVFWGPSRPPIVDPDPRITFEAPARRGDVAAAAAKFDCIGLVDGELYQSLAVTPSEIRAACERVAIFGAASLGALRAAEVPGMVGNGAVYAAFASGELSDDDELVGTWSADAQRTLAWPLVVAREALREVTVDASAIYRMKSLAFHERTSEALLRIVRGAGGDAMAFRAALEREPNIKQRDAALLFGAVRSWLDAHEASE